MGKTPSAPSKWERELGRLCEENRSLRAQLEDSQETLHAIQTGAVDALVVDTPDGQQVFTLQGADQTYRHLLEQMREGAATLSPDGVIHFCNQALADLFGLPLEQVIGTPVLKRVADADRLAFRALMRQGLSGHASGEVALITVSGNVVPAQIGLSSLSDANSAALLSMIVFDLTERKRAEAVLAETVEELHKEIDERGRAEHALQHEHRTLMHLLQATDRKRQAISLEIHDGLAQPIVSAAMHLEAASGMSSRTSKAAAKAQAAGLAMLRESINEARRLISEVRPPILEDEGVEAAIAHLAYERRAADAPQIELHIDAQFGRLDPNLESAIYRIAQEGIENACKHSRSERVSIDLLQQGDRLHIEVRDWGIGFDPQAIKEESFGLEEIRERVRLLGGTASIESAPGKGTRIVADLPLVKPTAGEYAPPHSPVVLP